MPADVPTITCEDDLRRWRRRWALLAPFSAIVMPVRVARRLDHAPLILAWGVHLVGLGFLVLVWGLLISWVEAQRHGGLYSSVEFMVGDVMQGLSQAARNPQFAGQLFFRLVAGFLGFEFVFLLAVYLAMSWGARPESWQRSMRRACVRAWLTTSHVAAYMVAMVVAIKLVDLLSQRKFQAELFYWSDLQFVTNLAIGLTLGTTAVFAGLWVISAGGWRAHCRWPGQCEGCGYALVGLGPRQTCPECGKAVSESLGPQSRPGVNHGEKRVESTADERKCKSRLGRDVGNCIADYFRFSYRAVRYPTALGRQLQLLSPSHVPWSFVVIPMALLVMVAVGFIGTLMFASMMIRDIPTPGWFEAFIPVLGMLCFLWPGYIGMVLLGASISGGVARQFAGRNLLPIAGQASLYLGGYLVAAATLLMILGLTAILLDMRVQAGPLAYVQPILGEFSIVELFTYAFLLASALLLGGYLLLAGRITWAGRFANR